MLRYQLFNVITCLWKANEIFKWLCAMYSSENPDSPLSYGFFLKQAFYVRSVTTKDVEIYCCKKHLHSRWTVSALLQLCKQQILNQVSLITISFSTPFPDNHTTIVNWDCAKDKKILCSHASVKLPGCWFSRKLDYPCQVWATESALVSWARLLLDLHHFKWWFLLLTLQ